MRTLFFLGIALGIAAVVAAAKFYPWVDPPRLPSETSVVANGGRAELFVIRLPADRIAGSGSADAGLQATTTFPSGMSLPAELLAGEPLLMEQFKVRDQTGTVIGIAARHWSEVSGTAATAWLLVIPSRGALMLTASGEPENVFDRALGASGWRAGEAWSGEVTLAAESDAGTMLAGSDEFDGLEGRYSETWKITGVSAAGDVQGTIELNTVTYRGGLPIEGTSIANVSRSGDSE